MDGLNHEPLIALLLHDRNSTSAKAACFQISGSWRYSQLDAAAKTLEGYVTHRSAQESPLIPPSLHEGWLGVIRDKFEPGQGYLRDTPPRLGPCPWQAVLTPQKAGICPIGIWEHEGWSFSHRPFRGQLSRTVLSVRTGREYLPNCPTHLCSSVYKPFCFSLYRDSPSLFLRASQPLTSEKKNLFFHHMMLYTLISSFLRKRKLDPRLYNNCWCLEKKDPSRKSFIF